MGVYPRGVDGDRLRRDRNDVTEVARSGSDSVSFAIEVTDTVQKAIPIDRCTWHTVGSGTVLFFGSVNRDVSCSSTWLAELEYAIEDVKKSCFPARSGHRAGGDELGDARRPLAQSSPPIPGVLWDRRRTAPVVRRRRHLLGRRRLPARQRPALVH